MTDENEEELKEDEQKYQMYQAKLDKIMALEQNNESENMDFQNEGADSEEDESVRLTNIDMNILMNEYKMISEDTQLVMSSLKYHEPVEDHQYSLN